MAFGDVNIEETYEENTGENDVYFSGNVSNYEEFENEIIFLESPKESTEAITLEESLELAKMYVSNYDVFHNRLVGASKTGPSDKKALLEQMAAKLEENGSRKTTKQIEQKIRDDIKRVKKYESIQKGEIFKTGAGRAMKPPKLSQAQQYMLDQLGSKPRIGGLPCGVESGVPVEIRQKEDQLSRESPKIQPAKIGHFVNKIRSSTPRKIGKEKLVDERKSALEADQKANIEAKNAYRKMAEYYTIGIEAEKAKAEYYKQKMRSISLPIGDKSGLSMTSSKTSSRSPMQ